MLLAVQLSTDRSDDRERVPCYTRKVSDPTRDAMTPDADDLSTTFVPTAGRYFAQHRPSEPPMAEDDPDDNGTPDVLDVLSSPDDGVHKALVIDMKNVIGDAVGNVYHCSVPRSFYPCANGGRICR